MTHQISIQACEKNPTTLMCYFMDGWTIDDVEACVRRIQRHAEDDPRPLDLIFIYQTDRSYLPHNFTVLITSLCRELADHIRRVVHVVGWANLAREVKMLQWTAPDLRDVHRTAYSTDEAKRLLRVGDFKTA